MIKNVLVTGGAGFIGSWLALELVKRGFAVSVLDNLSSQVHGDGGVSPTYLSIRDRVSFVCGDVRNKDDWRKALEGVEVIFHLAAETGTGQSMYEIQRYADTNISGTANMLDILANEKHSVRKIVVSSSRAVYGEGKYECGRCGIVYPGTRRDQDLAGKDFDPRCPVCSQTVSPLPTDEDTPASPLSIYGITKQVQESMTSMVCRAIGIPFVLLRYQNVYGPGQSLSNPYTGILSIFSTLIRGNRDINIFEDGMESRDFVYVEDVVAATILAMEKEEANGEIFNVGSGSQTTVMQVAASLRDLYQSDVRLFVSGDYRAGDIRHAIADLSSARAKLSFRPRFTFDEGIRRFAAWVQGQQVFEDQYDLSITEMKSKGLYKRSC